MNEHACVHVATNTSACETGYVKRPCALACMYAVGCAQCIHHSTLHACVQVAAEMSHVWRRATNQSRAPVPAYTGLNLLSALCELYQSSIQTSPDRPVIPNTKTSLRPADAAGYLLGVLQLQPWVKHSDIMSRPVAQKAILEAVLKSPAIGCLLSYLVVDSGNLRHELGGVCEKVVNVLQAAGQVAAEEVARGQQGLAGLKEELKALKAKLAEAYDVGRHEVRVVPRTHTHTHTSAQ